MPPDGYCKVKRTHFLATTAAIVILLLLVVGMRLRSRDSLRSLEYDGVQVFRVGNHQVIIETQSASIARHDNGPARIIVSTGGDHTVLDSWFDHDNWMDIRPGYISWRHIDAYQGLDLLLWKPSGRNELTAFEYISSGDGELHTLEVPLRKKHDLSVRFLF